MWEKVGRITHGGTLLVPPSKRSPIKALTYGSPGRAPRKEGPGLGIPGPTPFEVSRNSLLVVIRVSKNHLTWKVQVRSPKTSFSLHEPKRTEPLDRKIALQTVGTDSQGRRSHDSPSSLLPNVQPDGWMFEG